MFETIKSKKEVIRYEKGYESFALWLKERGTEEVVREAEEVEDRWSKGKVRRIATDSGEFLLKEKGCGLIRGCRLMREFENGLLLKSAGVPVLNIAVCVHARKRRRDYGFIPYVSGSTTGLHIIKNSSWTGFSDSFRKRIIGEVAAVVGSMHLKGFVHGDLNPSNILLAKNMKDEVRVFLLDFGGVRKGSSFSVRVKDIARLWRSVSATISFRESIRFLREYIRLVGGDLRKFLAGVEKRLRKIRKG
ncbi:MAG: lipopolysaccharide kinase InaA family protein [Planctomycetota bacterium]|nr:lipopolysaccharide kinase InaA family protein [Planctomycetota bacterium]